MEALEEALALGVPEIFNTDQGSQFTSKDFTNVLKAHRIAISMDGKGRVFDNIFIERLWRTVKYEEVYLKDYASVWEAIRVSKTSSAATTRNDRTRLSATGPLMRFTMGRSVLHNQHHRERRESTLSMPHNCLDCGGRLRKPTGR